MPRSDYDAGGQDQTVQDNSQYNALDPYFRGSEGTPIWGWLSGADTKVAAAHAQDAANQNRQYWNTLNAPTADQLTGPEEDREAQLSALGQLQQWASGAPTQTDYQNLDTQRQRYNQQAGAQRQAIAQQAQARGMGGSGLDLAMQNQAMQAGQLASSQAEGQMLNGVQQRALGATTAGGSLAGSIRSADAGAIQQAYQDAVTRAAGQTNQYSTDAGQRNALMEQQQDNNEGLMGLLGTILSSSE